MAHGRDPALSAGSTGQEVVDESTVMRRCTPVLTSPIDVAPSARAGARDWWVSLKDGRFDP